MKDKDSELAKAFKETARNCRKNNPGKKVDKKQLLALIYAGFKGADGDYDEELAEQQEWEDIEWEDCHERMYGDESGQQFNRQDGGLMDWSSTWTPKGEVFVTIFERLLYPNYRRDKACRIIQRAFRQVGRWRLRRKRMTQMLIGVDYLSSPAAPEPELSPDTDYVDLMAMDDWHGPAVAESPGIVLVSKPPGLSRHATPFTPFSEDTHRLRDYTDGTCTFVNGKLNTLDTPLAVPSYSRKLYKAPKAQTFCSNTDYCCDRPSREAKRRWRKKAQKNAERSQPHGWDIWEKPPYPTEGLFSWDRINVMLSLEECTLRQKSADETEWRLNGSLLGPIAESTDPAVVGDGVPDPKELEMLLPRLLEYDSSIYKERAQDLDSSVFRSVSDEELAEFDSRWDELIATNPDEMSIREFCDFWTGYEYKGHLRDSKAFQTFLAEYYWYVPSKQKFKGAVSKHLRFVGRTPYQRHAKESAALTNPPSNKHFEKWADKYGVWEKPSEEYPQGRSAGIFPPSGSTAEHASLIQQLDTKFEHLRKAEYDSAALDAFAAGFPAAIFPTAMTMKGLLREVFQNMDAQTSAAWSKITGHADKGDWYSDRRSIMALYLQIVLYIVTDHYTLKEWTPLQKFDAGMLTPEESFIKREVHKRKKSDTNRWRLIWHCSAAADALCRFFHHVQNKLEITMYQNGLTHTKAFPTFCSCSGMGHDDASIADTCEAMDRMLGGTKVRTHNGVALDAKSWDIAVSAALLMADAWRRHSLALAGGWPENYAYGILNLGLVISSHLIVIGCDIFEVDLLGIVPSGYPSTTSSNCFMRGFAHSHPFQVFERRFGLSLTMGDDCHGKDTLREEHRQNWHDLGLVIVDPGERIGLDEKVSFTSHEYDIDQCTAVFDNGQKLLLRLALTSQVPLTRDQATGIRFAVRNTSGLREEVDDFIHEINPDWVKIDVRGGVFGFDPRTVF